MAMAAYHGYLTVATRDATLDTGLCADDGFDVGTDGTELGLGGAWRRMVAVRGNAGGGSATTGRVTVGNAATTPWNQAHRPVRALRRTCKNPEGSIVNSATVNLSLANRAGAPFRLAPLGPPVQS